MIFFIFLSVFILKVINVIGSDDIYLTEIYNVKKGKFLSYGIIVSTSYVVTQCTIYVQKDNREQDIKIKTQKMLHGVIEIILGPHCTPVAVYGDEYPDIALLKSMEPFWSQPAHLPLRNVSELTGFFKKANFENCTVILQRSSVWVRKKVTINKLKNCFDSICIGRAPAFCKTNYDKSMLDSVVCSQNILVECEGGERAQGSFLMCGNSLWGVGISVPCDPDHGKKTPLIFELISLLANFKEVKEIFKENSQLRDSAWRISFGRQSNCNGADSKKPKFISEGYIVSIAKSTDLEILSTGVVLTNNHVLTTCSTFGPTVIDAKEPDTYDYVVMTEKKFYSLMDIEIHPGCSFATSFLDPRDKYHVVFYDLALVMTALPLKIIPAVLPILDIIQLNNYFQNTDAKCVVYMWSMAEGVYKKEARTFFTYKCNRRECSSSPGVGLRCPDSPPPPYKAFYDKNIVCVEIAGNCNETIRSPLICNGELWGLGKLGNCELHSPAFYFETLVSFSSFADAELIIEENKNLHGKSKDCPVNDMVASYAITAVPASFEILFILIYYFT